MYNILKHAYRENYMTSTPTPIASYPIYTLTEDSKNVYSLTSTTDQLMTIFTSSTPTIAPLSFSIPSELTIEINATIFHLKSQSNISFKVYNYSSSSINYTVQINNKGFYPITTSNTYNSLKANSYDVWTCNGYYFNLTSSNNAI